MGIMNDVKSGADLTHPKPTISYVFSAVIAIAVIGIALWIYGKIKSTVKSSKVSSMATGLEAQSTKQLEGFL